MKLYNRFTIRCINAKYEFLFSNIEETNGWEYIGYNKNISRYIYRRLAVFLT